MIRVEPVQYHPATGYEVHVWRDETRLCTVYGGSPEEVDARAGVVVTAFQNPGFELPRPKYKPGHKRAGDGYVACNRPGCCLPLAEQAVTP